MSRKLNVPAKSPKRKVISGKSGTLLYPIHNHLETEPCTVSCPNFRANHIKETKQIETRLPMSSRKDAGRTKKFCLAIPEQLRDEDDAVGIYRAKATEARKLKDPAGDMAAAIYELLAKQEASHGKALRKIQREVCPI